VAAQAAILKGRDYALVELSRRLMPLLRALGDAEHDVLAKRLRAVRIEAPVFVTGLARSGTTMLLTLLAQADGVATHRYRDFPFLFMPLAWNWLQDRLGAAAGEAVERPHGDRIRITKESAEAFEEPIWQEFFPWVHDAARCHVLAAQVSHPAFEAFFASHLRKILWLRGGRRYVSKGNYNLARIEYLARLFPTARFVVPVRAPLVHVRSLAEQHALFCRYAHDDPRVPRYLAAAGHYEFGPQRRPVNFEQCRVGEIEAAWREGDDYRGYARQWAQAYAHVDRLRGDPSGIGHRILVLRFEDFCARPGATACQVLDFCGLTDVAGRVAAAAAAVSAPAERHAAAGAADTVWREVAEVAARFGYDKGS
jgi:hypothetical protein